MILNICDNIYIYVYISNLILLNSNFKLSLWKWCNNGSTNTTASPYQKLLYDDVKKYERFLCIGGLLIVIGVAIAAFVSYALWTLKPPSFKVESASVLFHKSNNSSEDAAIRAEWNIRFKSVKAGTDYYKFYYMSYFVECLRIGREHYLSNPPTIRKTWLLLTQL